MGSGGGVGSGAPVGSGNAVACSGAAVGSGAAVCPHDTSDAVRRLSATKTTRMAVAGYQALLDKIKELCLVSICTPFDEASVDVIEEIDIEIIKVASCSAKDWPLIERIAKSGKPVIISTGGLEISDIDNIVSFCHHKGVDFALMHCVSIYPAPAELCQLNQVETLQKRYPDITIGWSTHEAPDELDAVKVAYSKGARMFERHIGVETDSIKLNAYSSTPAQIETWISAYKKAQSLCGATERPPSPEKEKEDLKSLQRGVLPNGK